jgi:hypothetical protein
LGYEKHQRALKLFLLRIFIFLSTIFCAESHSLFDLFFGVVTLWLKKNTFSPSPERFENLWASGKTADLMSPL